MLVDVVGAEVVGHFGERGVLAAHLVGDDDLSRFGLGLAGADVGDTVYGGKAVGAVPATAERAAASGVVSGADHGYENGVALLVGDGLIINDECPFLLLGHRFPF